MKSITSVLSKIYKFSPEILHLEPPLEDIKLLTKFEITYDIKLPVEYKFLLSIHNGISLMGTSILGIHSNPYIESIESVFKFEHFEVINPIWKHLVPFSPDGGGNFYCFDTSDLSEDESVCPIVFWQCDLEYNQQNLPEKVNNNFAAWIEEVLVSWTLENYDYNGNPRYP